MPIRLQLDSDRNLTIFTVSGALAFEELRSVLVDVYASPEYTTRSLFDMREAKAGGLSGQQIQAMVDLIQSRRDDRAPSKWAIVAPRDVHFGLSRMFETYAEKLPVAIRTFHELEEAVAWLEGAEPDSGA